MNIQIKKEWIFASMLCVDLVSSYYSQRKATSLHWNSNFDFACISLLNL